MGGALTAMGMAFPNLRGPGAERVDLRGAGPSFCSADWVGGGFALLVEEEGGGCWGASVLAWLRIMEITSCCCSGLMQVEGDFLDSLDNSKRTASFDNFPWRRARREGGGAGVAALSGSR